MKPHYLIVATLTCSLLASVAQAQSDTAPTARQLELSREVIDASGSRANYDKTMDGVMRQIFAQAFQGQSGETSTQVKADLQQATVKTMEKLKPEMFEAITRAYAKTYTEAELDAILAFEKTPAGQAMTAKAPQLAQNVMAGVFALMPLIKSDMVNAVCDSMHCTPAQRQAVIAKINTPPHS